MQIGSRVSLIREVLGEVDSIFNYQYSVKNEYTAKLGKFSALRSEDYVCEGLCAIMSPPIYIFSLFIDLGQANLGELTL